MVEPCFPAELRNFTRRGLIEKMNAVIRDTVITSGSRSKLPTVTQRGNLGLAIHGIPTPRPDDSVNDSMLVRIINAYKHYATHGCIQGGKEARRRREQHEPLDNDFCFMPCAFLLKLVPATETTVTLKVDFIPCSAILAHIRDSAPIPPSTTTESAKPVTSDSKVPALKKDTSVRIDASWMEQLQRSSIRNNISRKSAPTKLTIPEGYRKMTPAEVQQYTKDYLYALIKDLEILLKTIYTRALCSDTAPDFYASQVQGYEFLL